ncbi:hypothetical protein [Kocuria rosea]|uniref:hypothetical protein n=1 Tax=Kocuria rosea TaxID=1275 RepID=UPI0011A244CD|nr:hypothetical protein [Kocuria rosea]
MQHDHSDAGGAIAADGRRCTLRARVPHGSGHRHCRDLGSLLLFYWVVRKGMTAGIEDPSIGTLEEAGWEQQAENPWQRPD